MIKKIIAVALTGLISSLASAEVGVSESKISIGMSAPFSGPISVYGLEMRHVISTYFASVNANGGISGRQLELSALDDGYETDRTVANTKILLEKKNVFALVGYYGSSPTTAALPLFSAAQTPLVGTISGADTLRNPVNRYMFNLRASYARETEAIINQLVFIGLKNIAVFYQNDGFGKSGLNGVTSALKKHGLAPVAVGTVERNSTDVASAVEAIAKAKPQAIVMVTLYKPTAQFVKLVTKRGLYPQFMTLSPVGADMLAEELGKDARGIGISQVMPYPWNDTIPVVKEYQRLMEQQVKDYKPSYYGIEAYIMAKTLVEGIRRSGKDLTREKLVTTLEAMNNFDLGGYRINQSSTSHNGSSFVDLTVIGNSSHVLH